MKVVLYKRGVIKVMSYKSDVIYLKLKSGVE